ncbi:MAG: hypothetical protein ACFB4I_18715 [Cyanophyceae cyanobacterium]
MFSIAQTPEVKALSKSLDSLQNSYDKLQMCFIEHVQSSFFENFVKREIEKIAVDSYHNVRCNVGQLNFTVINNEKFDYTIRLSPRMVRCPHPIKWLGNKQIIAIEGPGTATVKRMMVPNYTCLNNFVQGIEIVETSEGILKKGEFISSNKIHEVLDVCEIKSTVILHSLIVKNLEAELYWTFNQKNISAFSESSRVVNSRLRNILDIAYKFNVDISDNIYDLIFTYGDAQLKLSAIQIMLTSKKVEGFRELQKAIDSNNTMLSGGGQAILNRLFSS